MTDHVIHILRSCWAIPPAQPKEGAPSIPYRVHVCLVIVLGVLAWGAQAVYAQAQAPETDVIESAFREAVSLWASERFETLWERADAATRKSIPKEQFVFKMRDRTLRPACCFRQVQELAVTFQTPEDALVKAKMGFDSRTRGTTFDTTLTFFLRKEEGEWRVAVSDFLRLPDESLHRLFLVPQRPSPR